jgi:hypothetical protein
VQRIHSNWKNGKKILLFKANSIQREYSSNFFPLGGIWEENPDYNSEQAPFSNRNKEKMYYRKWTRNITLANSMGTCQEICGNIR